MGLVRSQSLAHLDVAMKDLLLTMQVMQALHHRGRNAHDLRLRERRLRFAKHLRAEGTVRIVSDMARRCGAVRAVGMTADVEAGCAHV